MTDAGRATRDEARSPATLPVFALVLVALVGFLPSSQRPALTVVIVVALVGTAVGLPLVVGPLRRGETTARLGVGFGLWCVVAAIVSGAPLAWTGEYQSATGAVFCLAVVGFWALGRGLPAAVVPMVGAGFLAGAAVNAAVAVLQRLVDLSAMDVYLFDDRSTGLLGNPVFLGAACATAVALLPLLARRTAAGAIAAAALLAAGTQMSGARNSIVVLAVAGLWSAWRCGRRRGAALLVALAIGLAAGSILQGNTETAGARLQSTTGVGPRLDNWGAGLGAAIDRPLTGVGPGRWRAATSPRRTLALARMGPDRLYADAHDLPVEYLATTGFVGAGLLVAWLGAVALELRRGARPELAAAALALLAFHALEPQHVTLTPLMLLLAGAAVRRRPEPAPSRARTAVQAALVVLVLVVGARIVVGDLLFRSGELDFALDRTQQASRLLWPWPNSIVTEGRIHAYQARTEKDRTELLKALDAARRARRLEPENPLRSIAVASFLGQLGRDQDALPEFARALALNPWSRQAFTGRADSLVALGRDTQARACRTASQLTEHPDGALRAARRACLMDA